MMGVLQKSYSFPILESWSTKYFDLLEERDDHIILFLLGKSKLIVFELLFCKKGQKGKYPNPSGQVIRYSEFRSLKRKRQQYLSNWIYDLRIMVQLINYLKPLKNRTSCVCESYYCHIIYGHCHCLKKNYKTAKPQSIPNPNHLLWSPSFFYTFSNAASLSICFYRLPIYDKRSQI